MDKEKLKLIVRNLKLLVDTLESEVYSDVDAYTNKEVPAFSTPRSIDYDELFDDDDGYPDQTTNIDFVTQNIWEHAH